jgi:hypothetical protein
MLYLPRMSNTDIFNLAGILLNFAGGVIITFSLSQYMTAIHGSIAIHDMQINALVKQEDKVLSADVANLLKIGVKNGNRRTIAGLILLCLGFVLQMVPFANS